MVLKINIHSRHLPVRYCLVSLLRKVYLLGFWLFFGITPSSLLAQTEVAGTLEVPSLQDLPIDSSFAWLRRNVSTEDRRVHAIGMQILRRVYRTREDSLIAQAHALLGNWHATTNIFSSDSILYHSKKTVEYYEKTGDKQKIAQYSRTVSIDYLNALQYEKAQEALFRALSIYEELGDERGIASTYRNLSSLAVTIEEPELSIKYADKAMELLGKVKNYSTMTVVYLDYIKSYQLLGQYDKAYKAAADCIEMVETKAPDQIFVATRAYAARGDVSIELKDYQRALDDYLKAWKIVEAEVGVERAVSWRAEVGIAYRYLGKYQEALTHLLPAIAAIEATDGYNVFKYYQETAICYKEMGNFQKALEYQETAIAIKDKMQQEKIAALESEAVVKYETGKKDQMLAAQEAELMQKTYTQRLTTGGLSVMAVLLFTLFYFFRKNQQTNTQLSIKNQENELLLKEIHHRVKNNLEMVSSLLKLQSVRTNDAAAKDVMQASQNRVQSMGIIHQKLYQGKNLASIEMLDYFKNLCENILDAFGVNDQVEIIYDMEPVELDVDTAVPIGLIVNELLTNSLKYAFPGGKKGTIALRLEEMDNNRLHLVVADNGIGNAQKTTPTGTGFGTQLVELLTNQLQGTLQADYQHGTQWSFYLEKANLN